MFIFDAHLDLSMNALEWNRDLTRPLAEIRAREHGPTGKEDRRRGTGSLPGLPPRQGRPVVATQDAPYGKPTHPPEGLHSPAKAWAETERELAGLRAKEEAG